jgi:hypothetical protein
MPYFAQGAWPKGSLYMHVQGGAHSADYVLLNAGLCLILYKGL